MYMWYWFSFLTRYAFDAGIDVPVVKMCSRYQTCIYAVVICITVIPGMRLHVCVRYKYTNITGRHVLPV